jgi:hypothetical protein
VNNRLVMSAAQVFHGGRPDLFQLVKQEVRTIGRTKNKTGDVQPSARVAPDTGSSPYRPLEIDLKEIRLHVLSPGDKHDDVCGELQYISLGDSKRLAYETISYVWGDPTIRGEMTLNGRKMDVPASSEAALRRMRHQDRERIVWIDAVCIN